MVEENEIISIYRQIEGKIKRRMEVFKSNQQDEKSIYKELVFCLLTPQSKARVCWRAVERLDKRGMLTRGDEEEIKALLKGVRFKNNKAHYIFTSRELFVKNKEINIKERVLRSSPFEIREWLVKNVKGMGYKEASHFLRNIGRGDDMAILDRHILRSLKDYGVIEYIPSFLTRDKYLNIESKMRDFSQKIGIPLSHLDLVFWYMRTGDVFK